ncbi:MAG: FdtA/QdtA family cupin domain-containing protein [Patescibacteria group bacterium]
MQRLRVKNTRRVTFPLLRQKGRGALLFGEEKKDIPFPVKRFYVISHVSDPQSVRGDHAHKRLRQIMLCLSGSCRLSLDDGRVKQTIVLKASGQGIWIGSGVWRTLKGFSPDCVVLVITDAPYRESDYIRDYQDFLDFAGRRGRGKRL